MRKVAIVGAGMTPFAEHFELGIKDLVPMAVSAGQARTGGARGGQARSGGGAARFEVTSLRAVRPILVKTIADLEKKDVAAAKRDMEDYDNAWNGVEVYVNTRSKEMYDDIEHNWQTKVTDDVTKGTDPAAALADAKSMLAKYDEMLAMVEKAPPLNALYDDVARLRIERSHLREVTPALKAGDIATGRLVGLPEGSLTGVAPQNVDPETIALVRALVEKTALALSINEAWAMLAIFSTVAMLSVVFLTKETTAR